MKEQFSREELEKNAIVSPPALVKGSELNVNKFEKRKEKMEYIPSRSKTPS